MAGRRHPPPSTRPLSSLSPTATHLALSRPDGSLTLFTLPTLSRTTLPSPTTSPPSALLLTSTSHPLLGFSSGALHLSTKSLPSLPSHVTALASSPTHLLATGGPSRDLLLLRSSDAKLIHRSHHLADHRAPISALALAHNSNLAALCSQAVSLVDPRSGTVLRRFTGHTAPVVAAAFLPGDARLITACERDRFVSLWDAHVPVDAPREAAVKRRRKSTSPVVPPVATLLAPEAGIVALAVDQQETSGASVAACFASGNVAVWSNWTEKGSADKKPTQCSFVVRNASNGGKAAPVFGAAFGKVGVLTIAYGSALKPSVFSVRLCDVDGAEVVLPLCETEVLVKKVVQEGKGKSGLVKKEAAVEGSSAPAMPKEEERKMNGLLFDKEEDDREEELSEDDSEEEEQGGREEEGLDGDDEPSIQQKLIALGISQDGENFPAARDFPVPAGEKGVLGSRVNVLMQAVRSQDPALFDETIDRMRDTKLIKTTVERLPQSVAAGDFLDMLVDRLQRYPTKAEYLVRWIREVLLEHTGALISQQRNKALIALIEIINERTQALEGLSRLQGRLELVVARADKLKRAGARIRTGDAVPRAEYEEEEGSQDEEEQDESSEEGSEESGSDTGSEEAEDETGDFGSEKSSSEEGSDEEMEDVADRDAAETEKGVTDDPMKVKMNGHHVADEDEEDSSESEESSDEGD